LLLALGSGGCLEPVQPSPAHAPGDPDIVAVKKFYAMVPWLSFDDAGDPNPEGFKVTVYLISSKTDKGAFGEGDILVSLYEYDSERPPRGEKSRPPQMIHQWALTPDDAMPFRAKNPTVMGYGYQLRLTWGELDLLGKTISINIDFRRPDGRIIRGQPQTFQVPEERTVY
jgi:hypothetical protein